MPALRPVLHNPDVVYRDERGGIAKNGHSRKSGNQDYLKTAGYLLEFIPHFDAEQV